MCPVVLRSQKQSAHTMCKRHTANVVIDNTAHGREFTLSTLSRTTDEQ